MITIYLLQRDVGLAVFHRGHEAPTLALSFELLATLLKVSIQSRQFLPEIIYRTIEVVVGHEEVFLYVLLLYLIASLAGEDN